MSIQFDDWLTKRSGAGRRRPLSVHTLRQKASCLATVRDRAEVLWGITNDKALAEQLTEQWAVFALFDHLALTRKPGTLRNIFFALRDFERYAQAQGWVGRDGFALADEDCPAADPSASVEVFTQAELDAIWTGSKMKGQRWHLFIATLMLTGRRSGEVLALTFDDVKLDAEVPHLVLRHTKSQKAQYAPLNTELQRLWSEVDSLRELAQAPQHRTSKDPERYPFCWTYTNALARWRDMLDALEIPYRSPHKLRHTKATQLIASGAPITGVSRLLGHANVATTDRFYNQVTSLHYADLLE